MDGRTALSRYNIGFREISLLIVMAALIILTVAVVTADDSDAGLYDRFTVDGIEYQITSSNTVTITYADVHGVVVIPSSVMKDSSEYSVTAIQYYAFSGQNSLLSVTVPGTVKIIEREAFKGCQSLTTVSLCDGVETIQYDAFKNCYSLTTVIIPDSISYIDPQAFLFCKSLSTFNVSSGNSNYSAQNGILFDKEKHTLCTYPAGKSDSSYTVPDTVTAIGDYAFFANDHLTEIKLDINCVSTGFESFACVNLRDIEVPSDSQYLYSDDGILFNKAKTVLIKYPSAKNNTAYNVPQTVTAIDKYAFENCTSLTSIILPDGLIELREGSFAYCCNLKSIALPQGLVTIGDSVFLSCYLLESLDVPDSVSSFGFSVLGDCINLRSVIIRGGLTEVDDYMFAHCERLTDVTLPDTVTKIGTYAFVYCISLKTIEIPSSVESIGLMAFFNCVALESISIPDSVVSIQPAFGYCSSLKTVYIGSGLSSLSNRPFFDCPSLEEVVISGDNSYYSSVDNVVFNKSRTTLIKYPQGLTSASYTVPSGVTAIETYAFYENKYLESVILPDGITVINDDAFSGCSSIDSIVFPDTLITLGDSAFADCESLTSVTINDNLSSIGEYAFFGCDSLIAFSVGIGNDHYSSLNNVLFNKSQTKLLNYPASKTSTSYTVPDTVEIIEQNAFTNCKNLTEVIFDDNLKTISSDSFSNCTSLTIVNIPKGLTQINRPFDGCTSITEFNVASDNASYSSLDGVLFDKLGQKLISYPLGKTTDSYTVPGTVNTIGAYSFMDCTNIVSVTLPDTVINIEWYAFSGCTSLTTLTFSNNLETIDMSAFYGCTSLASVSIPASVKKIDLYSFNLCTSLTAINVDPGNEKYSSVNGVLYNKYQTTLIQYPLGKADTSFELAANVTTINDKAFAGAVHLTDFIVAEGNMNYSAIDGVLFDYDKYTLIIYPAGRTASSYTVPYNVSSLSGYAFYRCPDLTTIVFPRTFGYPASYSLDVGTSEEPVICTVVGFIDKGFEMYAHDNTEYLYKPGFIVTYNLNGGTGSVSSDTVIGSYVLKSYDGTKPGYNFKCWTDGVLIYEPGATVDVTKDMTFSALWEKIRYTVSYDVNGGSGSVASDTANGDYVLKSYDGKKDGYRFKGWSDGTETFDTGATVKISKDTVFTAVWESTGSDSNTGLIIVGIVAVIAVIALSAFLLLKRKP